MSNSSIWLIDRNLWIAITPDQSGAGNDSKKGVLRIPPKLHHNIASPSEFLMSYQDTRWRSYHSAQMSWVYLTVLANRADQWRRTPRFPD